MIIFDLSATDRYNVDICEKLISKWRSTKKENTTSLNVWMLMWPVLARPEKKRWLICKKRWNYTWKIPTSRESAKLRGLTLCRSNCNMPKPVALKRLIEVLKNQGFFFVCQKGSHAKYRKNGSPNLTVIVPIHGNEIPHGTFRSILRQACLTENDFE